MDTTKDRDSNIIEPRYKMRQHGAQVVLHDDGAWVAPGSRCPRYGLEVDWWALGVMGYI